MENDRAVTCGEALTALGFVGLCVAFALHYPNKSEEWAAWMQAFGSVAAIAGAGWIARVQLREGARGAADLRVQQLRAIATLVDQLFVTFNSTAEGLQSRGLTGDLAPYARLRIAPLQVAVAALEAVPLHTIPNAYVGLPLSNLKNMIHHGLEILSAIDVAGPTAHQDGYADLIKRANQFSRHRDRAKEDLDKIWAITEAYKGYNSPVVLARDL